MKDLCPACGNESPCADHELSAPSPSPAGAVGAASAASSADPVGEADELLARIKSYLGNGGLFNPEMMEHEKVRDLVMDCRKALDAQAAERAKERTAREAAEQERDAIIGCEDGEVVASLLGDLRDHVAMLTAAESRQAEALRLAEAYDEALCAAEYAFHTPGMGPCTCIAHREAAAALPGLRARLAALRGEG